MPAPPPPASRILVVDDESSVRESVGYALEQEGFEVTLATDGEDAEGKLTDNHYDLLILDIMMPGKSGLDICREVRSRSPVPIILLTAKDAEVDKVVGLEVGADDYVVKPFSPRELVARVRAILRRAQEPADVSIRRIGELEVDEARHSVTVQGTSVELTAKEFGLLCALIRANGRVLNREQLLEGVWGYADAAEIESRTVDVHIRRLREKLGAEAKRIVTVKGVGYRFDMEG